MRRATAALLGTVAGTALLVGAKYGTAPAAGGAIGETTALADPVPSDNGSGDGGGVGTTGPSPSPSPRARATLTARPTGVKTSPASGATSRTTSAPTRSAPACTTSTGSAASVSRPGVGAVTVTIKVCGSVVSAASGTLSRSNWDRNTAAIPALNAMAVKYYKTGFSQIHYSGASLTSAAYQASLKSALSKAGI